MICNFPTSQTAARIHGGWRRSMGLSPLRGSLRAARRQKYHDTRRESWRQFANTVWGDRTRSLPSMAVFDGGCAATGGLGAIFPLARPVRNVCIRGYLLFEVRDASLSYTLLRAKSRRILSMISRSSPIRVLASRSSRAFWAGDKYLFRRRESSTTYTPPLYLPGTVVSG